mmetsp:Transcript_2396/g.5043  ORF Transcript_2396/g.5043 Transcript_2396/m.5043 type:complete len:315 (+) Transcript_2396:1-945(+)
MASAWRVRSLLLRAALFASVSLSSTATTTGAALLHPGRSILRRRPFFPTTEGKVPVAEREFLINGWRWHHLSVLRDLRRFIERVQHLDPEATDSVSLARVSYDYVWGFSWRALYGIETRLYIPWLRRQLPQSYSSELDIFQHQIEDMWQQGLRIGDELRETNLQMKVMSTSAGVLQRLSRGSIVDHSHFLWSASSRESAERRARLARVVRLSQQLERHAQRVYADSEHYLVPCVAAHATAAEQEAFNQAVVKSLGIWSARIHLVGMAEVIAGNSAEERRFRQQVPAAARMMIPRWRRQLYLPKTECLRDAKQAR